MLEQLTGPICAHGEAPVWCPTAGGLHWVDLTSGAVLRIDDAGAVQRWPAAPLVSAVRPRRTGGYVLTLERSVGRALEWGAALTCTEPLWAEPDLRCNDAGCDPSGNLWFGAMATDYAPGRGSWHRLRPAGDPVAVLHGCGVPNGIDWTPDGGTAYVVDTLAGTVDAFDWSPAGGLSGRRPFVRIPLERGRPDGLAVDAEGCVWVALWSGGAIHRYRPDATLDGVLEVPVRAVSACTFGGPQLDQLYITTIRGPEPESGALFRAAVGVRGQPVRPFAG